MSSPNPSSRRDRLTGHGVVAVAVLALVVVTAESARQSLALPGSGDVAAVGAADAGPGVPPATLPPGPLPTPVPVIDNANAIGSVAPPAGPTATGPALATFNADTPRAVAVGPALGVGSVTHEETIVGSSSPSPSDATSRPSPSGASTAAPTPPPSVVASNPPTPEPTPEPTPKPDKPRPTHPPHPHSPSPSPAASETGEPDPTP